MNFKRNCLMIIALTGCAISVSACKNKKSFVAYNYLSEVSFFDENAAKKTPYANYVTSGKSVDIGGTYNVLTKYGGQHILNSTGERKLLVIPVDFEDYRVSKLDISKSEYVENLRKAFFGNSKVNKYVSVAEFYNRSSYGQLKITGKVVDKFYQFPYSVSDINNDMTKDNNIVSNQYTSILEWYKENYGEDDLNQYRLDPSVPSSDVAIYLVYDYPTENSDRNKKVFWDYTFTHRPFAWSSYTSLNTIAGEPDAHTLIHETGHLLGLPDYYPTDEGDLTTDAPEPTARIDMMDCSVGDHTSFSKMMLNWIKPYYVKDTETIKLSALTNIGDVILLKDDWNQTVFDEYYLIEFYSPTGLNLYDTNIGNNKAKLPLIPGVKIYHVDARLAFIDANTKGKKYKYIGYCDDEYITETPSDVNPNIRLAHDNSTYQLEDDVSNPFLENYLYTLQLNHTNKYLTSCATEYHLFHKGDSYTNFTFNEKDAKAPFKVTISNMTFRDAEIKIERVEE